MRFATPQGFNSGDQFFAYLKDSFDTLYAEGKAGRPRMMNIGLHCRLVGRPGRAAALKRFIDYVKGHDKVWLARRIDIARHWRETHPFRPPALRPSRMERDEFVAKFGGIFEHSPWIAERAYELELGPAHDTRRRPAQRALPRLPRRQREGDGSACSTRIPTLPASSRAAKRLTAESTSEQASAGLDALTDAERELFSEAQRRLCHDLRLSLHHRGAGARPRTRSWRPSKRASATTAPPNSTPPAGRSSASRCSG